MNTEQEKLLERKEFRYLKTVKNTVLKRLKLNAERLRKQEPLFFDAVFAEIDRRKSTSSGRFKL